MVTVSLQKKGFEELDGALAVDDAAGVKGWDARDWDAGLFAVEVYEFCVVGLEREYDWIGWEDGEFGVEFLVCMSDTVFIEAQTNDKDACI